MPQGGLDKKALVFRFALLTTSFLVTLLLALPSPISGNPSESNRELFQRVCTLCHGWAVENFLVAEGMVEGMEPICPPPFANWLPVVLTVATYQVKIEGKEETFPLIPRRDILKVVEYLNENYPREPICTKTWKKDIK